jgi:aminoglycoside phosphotransferase (APT) family kinase protein
MLHGSLLDIEAVTEWVGDRLPGAGERLTAVRIGEGAGMANALFLISRAGHRWVLRRPPAVKNDPSASDTAREWRILTALEGTPVPHPAPRLLCEDPAVIGAPFMVMDHVEGFTPGFDMPADLAADGVYKAELAAAYVDGIAELSKVDWRARGLVGLGRPDGFLERQVPRWMAQLERYRTRDLPGLGTVTEWLEANRPGGGPPAIIHGDYSPYNVMVGAGRPARLAAIVDWDTGTIGDPLLDIGHLLGRWTDPGEEPLLGPDAGGHGAWPPRSALAQRYAAATGRDLAAISYYAALALYKLAIILEGSYARAAAAGLAEADNTMAVLVPRLLEGASDFASGRRSIRCPSPMTPPPGQGRSST